MDTSRYDGPIEIVVIGSDSVTRYGVWTPFVTLNVDNPPANIPSVKIVNPEVISHVHGIQTIRIAADGKNPIDNVEVRINGGAWQTAQRSGNLYELAWDTDQLGKMTNSIEARVVDAYGNIGKSSTTYVKSSGGLKDKTKVGPQDRAMWIWESESYPLILNPGSRTVLHAMAKDTATFGQDPVTTLYLGVDKYYETDMLEDERDKVRDFVSSGIK